MVQYSQSPVRQHRSVCGAHAQPRKRQLWGLLYHMTGPLKSTNLSQKICSARAFPFSRLHRWRFFHFPLYFRKKRHSFSKELRRFSPN
ncbi:hypothetical protein DXA32_09885 [Subdoligranulum sp. OF01-18]|nr:hypothetical protein DW194_12295 [Subdoligranulum sp. AM16-9]RJW81451.1 hypothetical protein DXA32_09885 [Subdoligranulum sp. OF01-18]